jgi:hypothetical protein
MSDEIEALFDIEDRGFRIRAFYVPETLNDSEFAHVCITRNGDIYMMGYYMAYRVWNLAAHLGERIDEILAREAA